jgi:hypothetical protein
MKNKFFLLLISIFFLFSFSFPAIQERIFPFAGYIRFHDYTKLKRNNIFAGISVQRYLIDNVIIDITGGLIPSMLSNVKIPVIYGSGNSLLLLPIFKSEHIIPFISMGVSVLAFDGKINRGIETGLGAFLKTDNNIMHKVELKTRYNVSVKQFDILGSFAIGVPNLGVYSYENIQKEKEVIPEHKMPTENKQDNIDTIQEELILNKEEYGASYNNDNESAIQEYPNNEKSQPIIDDSIPKHLIIEIKQEKRKPKKKINVLKGIPESAIIRVEQVEAKKRNPLYNIPKEYIINAINYDDNM